MLTVISKKERFQSRLEEFLPYLSILLVLVRFNVKKVFTEA